jgi:Arm DNA-binding domain
MKTLLTDRFIKSLKPAPAGTRVTTWDSAVPSFAVRTTDAGSASFIVMRRIRGGKPIRRTIGVAWRIPLPKGIDALPYSLSQAREDARAMLIEMSHGVDPKVRRIAEAQAKDRAKENSFELVAEAYIKAHVSTLRAKAEVTSVIRKK